MRYATRAISDRPKLHPKIFARESIHYEAHQRHAPPNKVAIKTREMQALWGEPE